jgi:hypothetical protein
MGPGRPAGGTAEKHCVGPAVPLLLLLPDRLAPGSAAAMLAWSAAAATVDLGLFAVKAVAERPLTNRSSVGPGQPPLAASR